MGFQRHSLEFNLDAYGKAEPYRTGGGEAANGHGHHSNLQISRLEQSC